MFVLHASFSQEAIEVWAETSEKHMPEKKRVYYMSKKYKHAANSNTLRKLLRNIGISSTSTHTNTILLPTDREGNPIPSSDIISKLPENRSKIKLQEWGIDTTRLSGRDAVDLLCLVIGKRTIGAGITIGADLAYMAKVMQLAGSIVAKQQYLPNMERENEWYRAVWVPILTSEDSKRFESLVKCMPSVVLALDRSKFHPSEALRQILAFLVDNLVRTAVSDSRPTRFIRRKNFDSVHDSWLNHLMSKSSNFMIEPDASHLHAQIHQWQQPVMVMANSTLRFCFRLEEPQGTEDRWFIRYLLQSRDDPSLLIPAKKAWNSKKSVLSVKNTNTREFILRSLGHASGIFPDITANMGDSDMQSGIDGCSVNADDAYWFLTGVASALEQVGYGVIFPSWWTGRKTRSKIKAHANIKTGMKTTGMLDINSIISFDWEIAIGDDKVSLKELQRLAKAKSHLVQMRGEWIEMSHEEIKRAIELLKKRTETMSLLEAIKIGLSGEDADTRQKDSIEISVTSKNSQVQQVLQQLEGKAELKDIKQPEGFAGDLRPYQLRGLAWLEFLQRWGLGGCLADDMGLGKTIQILALVQSQHSRKAKKPFLLVCPTSVIGNWQKEASKFTPKLKVMVHHGQSRSRDLKAFKMEVKKYDMVISSYGLLQRDVDIIKEAQWDGIVLDEAQNVKNPHTLQSKAARLINARTRFALTGTPVENNVGDLWAIMEFLNPGFLGTQTTFKHRFFIPIQSMQDEDAIKKLKKATGPFILRRLKTDKTVIADLPKKMEMTTYCQLTKEQASLYVATLKDLERKINAMDHGIQRKGAILSLIAKLKQICNHPATFLKDKSSIATSKSGNIRSGKLARTTEMLSEVLEAGQSALVFTQFVDMGHMLKQHIHETLGCETLFLHGGTTRRQRDSMIEKFQKENKPMVFVISLKAGGTGLNLTAASHVFHFDRWWNPAVEDQATDRAFRIGQKKNVQVYKMVCSGTLEEKIDRMIKSKKNISKKIIRTGEKWLTEMSNKDLKEMFTLDANATMVE